MRGDVRLVGRDDDEIAVLSALRRTGCCTLVGPGGVGKTSLAYAVASRVVDRPVFWVDAEPLADTAVLLDSIVLAVGQERLPGQSPADAVGSALGGSTALVVLDGVEHLGEQLERAAAAWPSSAEGPWWLVTSRRPLGAALRPVVQLPPLPTSGEGARSPAAQLLVAEVAARGGDVEALATDHDRLQRLVDATGGLPVAIQLTADHVARFGVRFAADQPAPVEEIVHRCIERTLALLTPNEARVFERLGLTAGSFTIELVTGCGGGTREETQRLAARLLDHGLLIADAGRLDLLPPIRDGALSLLDRRGATAGAVEDLLAWALSTPARGGGSTTGDVLADNLDTVVWLAWETVRRSGPSAVTFPLVRRLFAPMYERLRQRELLALLEALLDENSSMTWEPREEAEVARLAAICASECDTIARARRWLDVAHACAARVDDPAVKGRTWSTEAWMALDAGRLAEAFACAEQAVTSAPDHRDDVVLPSMRCVAEAALAAGDLDRAERVAGDVLARCDGPDSFDGLLARTTLGWCLVERGRYAEAVGHARRLAGDIPDRLGDTSEIEVEAELIAIAADPHIEPVAPSLDNDQRFTWYMRLQQRVRLAARLPIADSWERVLHMAADVVVLADLVPLSYPRLAATILLADAAFAGGDLRQAAISYEQALRDAARAPHRLRGADSLDGVAALLEHAGDSQVAGSAAAAASAIREELGAAPWPRPSLPSTVTASRPVPTGWLDESVVTPHAIEEIARALRAATRVDPLAPLTSAERQITRLVRQGMSNAEIADHLTISRRTVESHLSHIYRKLDLRTRTQLATLRGEHLDPPEAPPAPG